MDRIKILVVDDKKIIGDLFNFTLGFGGHDIAWVNNAYEALEQIRQKKFDIIFVDIVMPEKDGVDLLEEIKKIAPEIPIVMMSGYSVEEKRIRALELGAVSCMKKPFEMDEVRQIVKAALGKEI